MNNIVNFILESGISLALFSLIYVLFLRRETFFMMNRFYLLASIMFSVILPFLRFAVYEPGSTMLGEVTVTPYRNVLESVTVYGQGFSGGIENFILSSSFIIYIYVGGLTFFIGRFLLRLFQMVRLIRQNNLEHIDNVNLIVLDNEFSPFSFLNYVFVSRDMKQNNDYHRMIAHEIEHVKQGHSLDILMLELLAAIQWFNPFIWMLKRAIRENHEYLADKAVLQSGVNHAVYKQLLLSQFVGEPQLLANSFNYSLIKNRIKMISKIKSSKIATAKFIGGIVIALALIVAFACEKKDSSQAINSDSKSEMSISMEGESVQIIGADDDLNKVKDLLSSGSFEISKDPEIPGVLSINKKSKISREVVVVSNGDKQNSSEQVYSIVEEMPEFPGGNLALRKFIAKGVMYPKEAQEKGIQGKVFVAFVVNEKGDAIGARIARGVDPSLDQEALRVISNLPKWKPGYQKGKAVNVEYTVPINFVLQ